MRVALLLVIATACGKSETPAPSEAPKPTTTAPTAALDAAAKAAPMPSEASLEGIAPLDLAPVSAAATRKARDLARAARELNKSGDHAGAAAKYTEALAADPGQVMARYNLACALNMAGDDRGLAVLKQFKTAACPLCLGRLVRARDDSDWTSKRSDPRFVALTGDVEIPERGPMILAELFAKQAMATSLGPFADYVHPRAPIKVSEDYLECMQQGENCDVADSQKKTLVGVAALDR